MYIKRNRPSDKTVCLLHPPTQCPSALLACSCSSCHIYWHNNCALLLTPLVTICPFEEMSVQSPTTPHIALEPATGSHPFTSKHIPLLDTSHLILGSYRGAYPEIAVQSTNGLFDFSSTSSPDPCPVADRHAEIWVMNNKVSTSIVRRGTSFAHAHGCMILPSYTYRTWQVLEERTSIRFTSKDLRRSRAEILLYVIPFRCSGAVSSSLILLDTYGVLLTEIGRSNQRSSQSSCRKNNHR